jgi:hypothetical protein
VLEHVRCDGISDKEAIGPSSLRITKNHPSALGRLSGDVVERMLPEFQHLVELITADDNRADLHFSNSVHQTDPLPRIPSVSALAITSKSEPRLDVEKSSYHYLSLHPDRHAVGRRTGQFFN